MKFTLLLLFVVLGLNTNSHAQTVTVIILEGWKSTPLENCAITLESKTASLIETIESDSNGIVVFKGIGRGVYTVTANDSSGNFEEDSFWSDINVQSDVQVQLILYPNYLYEHKMLRIEDSLYLEKKKPDTINISHSSLEIDSIEIENDLKKISHFIETYIEENVIYPEISRELGDQGSVYVEFIIESDGTITNVKIRKGISIDLDRECRRVVRTIPNLSHLRSTEQTDRIKIRYPIIFTLY